MTNHPQVISNHCVYPASIGDHDMVGCVRKLNHLEYSPRTVFSRNYSTYDPAVMNEDFKNVIWCFTAVKLFNEIVKGVFLVYFGKVTNLLNMTTSVNNWHY